jgi:AcrR family transcriptional regulator
MVHEANPTDERRQRQRRRRARHFLEAAQAVLDRDGAAHLTIAAVAAEADAAVGTLYRYFDGKDGLLAALQVHAVEAFEDHLADALRGVDDPLDRLRAAARAWRTFADADPPRFGLLDASLSDPAPNLSDDAARAVEAALRPVLGRIASAFADAEAHGRLAPGDPLLRTYALWATAHGAAHFRKRDRLGGPQADAVADAAIEALLAGWSGAGR